MNRCALSSVRLARTVTARTFSSAVRRAVPPGPAAAALRVAPLAPLVASRALSLLAASGNNSSSNGTMMVLEAASSELMASGDDDDDGGGR
eukprot:CAMPEP_0177652110 /NCGR_PEP_ID=MMETSP0447-20121125/12929_1 /TAXON_ID=0 /ORGANISM="Stygamoeba regulata, Strain BSH-02190019" /LENGTH=90 /DNA_ID=CAMNT_0019155281 /DNA_START=60 /DNA_END=332 /DNA_ORIENTATION=-